MIYQSSRSITSSSCAEWARRRADPGEPAWELSWWPEVALTFEQARDAMELAELCSASAEPGERAEVLASQLGTSVKHVMAVLHQRMMERGRA
ncbi:hypothetical protein OHB26_31315 [Nocardia sp. NBC_01503]|uniref:hypothetical protein n=1 Tax=Nocardia sp. NBC_01503 TaxID=2975997 RepID=UPI002E7C42FF|nr:hypothetical protein [Nocardia sp. NBC_01503]WTL31365.1 hypothetical protein OHB26_31315 [Nocardia sp. NBC_01503]